MYNMWLLELLVIFCVDVKPRCYAYKCYILCGYRFMLYDSTSTLWSAHLVIEWLNSWAPTQNTTDTVYIHTN